MADLGKMHYGTFFDRLEDAIPKIILMPTFLAALIFIYGFILWTAWISLTQSGLLPNYKIAAGYKITQKGLKNLRNAGLPESVLEKLGALEKESLANKKPHDTDTEKQ